MSDLKKIIHEIRNGKSLSIRTLQQIVEMDKEEIMKILICYNETLGILQETFEFLNTKNPVGRPEGLFLF